MRKVCIFFNNEKTVAIEMYHKSVEFFKENDIEILDISKNEEADFFVVIGGDGTLLRSFKQIINLEKYVIAINAGSLGFLTEIKIENAIQEYRNFLNNDFKYEKRSLFLVEMQGEKFLALNDVIFTKENIFKNIFETRISVSGEYMNTYKGDGVIVATPTGSTAYSLSAGGPIIKSDLKLYTITPIAEHNLNTRTIILDGSDTIEMQVAGSSERGYVVVDGDNKKIIKKDEIVKISYSSKTLKLVIPKKRNYYNILKEKLKWGDNLC